MAPSAVTQVLLSPAELSYLHASLSLSPPLRPDGRTSTQFRPLIAEQDILPSTNGSARVCFADGTEAIVGVKAEVEKSNIVHGTVDVEEAADDTMMDEDNNEEGNSAQSKGQGENDWVEMSIDIPGYRNDDPLPVFVAAMLSEALVGSGELKDRLWISRRFHWKLYIDVRPYRSMTASILIMSGSSPFSTIIIPIAASINHYSSRPAFCTPSGSGIRRG
jgi:exosome complex component RRP42